MATYHHTALAALSLQISQYSPNTISLLDHMKHQYGSEIAYYAAFVIVCLRAKQQRAGRPLEITASDLQTFTFFQAAKDYPGALALFDEVLAAYQRDQADQTHPFQPRIRIQQAGQATTGSVSAG